MEPAMTTADSTALLRSAAIVALFNTAVAMLLSVARFGPLGETLLYSQSIGLCLFLCVRGAWRALWPGRRPPVAGLALVVALAIPLAWLGGSALAAALLGQPWPAALSHAGLAALTITAAAGIVAAFFFWNRVRVAQLRAHAAQAELRMLQAQIEPHFLFNTLANLDALIASDPERARTMLGHLNDYLRGSLAAARGERHTLGNEFTLLSDYLELLAIRMGPRLAFALELPSALAPEPLPPMLLQPLVENAVRHGLEPRIEGGRVTVRARRDGAALVLTVEDDGTAPGAARSPGGGVGLAHTRERLAALYGGQATLELVENPAGGTTARLSLPGASHGR
jgi:signal transduction histidine kinase